MSLLPAIRGVPQGTADAVPPSLVELKVIAGK